MTAHTMLAAAIASAALAYLLVCLLLRLGAAGIFLDLPNHRSLHSRPVPRIGGVVMVPAIVIPAVILAVNSGVWSSGALFLALSWLPVFLVSIWDDWHPLPPLRRLLVHLGACAAWLAWIVGHGLPWDGWMAWLAVPLAWLGMGWMLNLYNFMDGLDGLASGMGVIGFASLSGIAWLGVDPEIATISALISGATFGVWLWNRPPGRIFLGDAGAASLGFVAAALGLWGWQRGSVPFWVVPAVFSPFITDASLTLMFRLFKGRRLWEAHRDHLYQKLVLARVSIVRVLLAEYVTMLAVSGAVYMVINNENAMLNKLVLFVLVLLQVTIRIGLEGSRRLDAGATDSGCEGL
ncbi:MAG: glycosyltransferase family 4 protein [Rhodothermales bacterium]